LKHFSLQQNIYSINSYIKGGCGISLRYYDTNLAFLTSHFASDSGGKLRFALRNQHVSWLLSGAVLESSDQGIDVSLAHHHTFVSEMMMMIVMLLYNRRHVRKAKYGREARFFFHISYFRQSF
jgi:hypothetical protein